MAFFKNNRLKILILSFFVLAGGLLYSPKDAAAACVVNDADFRSNAQYPADDFYWEGNEAFVYVDIQSAGCVGGSFKITIRNEVGFAFNGEETGDVNVADEAVINVSDDNFTLAYRATQEGCASNQTLTFAGYIIIGYGYESWDCAFTIYIQDEVATNDTPDLEGWTIYENEFGEVFTENSALQFDCYGTLSCDFDNADWTKVIGDDGDNIYPFQYVDPNQQNFANWDDSIPDPLDINGDYIAPLPGLAGQTPDLGGFLKGLFQVLIVIAGLLAMIMLVMGAITYLSSDAFSGKSSGKDMMTSAVFGLILALGAWVIINTINPNLASSLSIKIPKLKLLEGDTDVYNSSPTTVAGGTNTAFTTLPSDIGLYCPMTGGSAAIQQIITSFVGKVAYRWGGKGGPLPAGSNYPLSPSEVSNGAYKCTNDAGEKVPCNTFCPAGNVCLDCSGFVNHVRKCAGAPVYPTGTAGMTALSNAEAVDMSQLNATGTQIGSYVLVPGDILVWNGHVVIYFGNGKIAEAAGGAGGRQKGGNVKIGSIKQYKDDITHILKIQ